MNNPDTFVLGQARMRELSLCTVQSYAPGAGYRQVCAEVLPGYAGHALVLTSHDVPDEDQADALGAATAHIELSPDGWRTLVEMFALRRPEAFEQIVARGRALKEARG